MSHEPAWQLILAAARHLSEHNAEFSRVELIDEVRRGDPTRRPDSLGPVIQGMTRDATGGPPSPCGTPLIRVSRGRYTLADASVPRQAGAVEPAYVPLDGLADIALIGCVKTKADHPAPARDLYISPLFVRRRAYVERHARRYYILSAEHGLISPDTVLAPYDTALAQQSAAYRSAWGGWVLANWSGEPRAADLAARLRRFPGIGQKKAAMAVEILARDLGVSIRDLSGSDIAYDVHVRRVFLRTRLADSDDLEQMVEVARWLHPERPGELDFPAWLIGRRWCGPGTPNCSACPLATVCPQDVGKAASVS